MPATSKGDKAGVNNPSKKFECVFFFSHVQPLLNPYSWAAKKAARLAGPAAPGSKEIPDGAADALLGLSFVFTGELSSFSRDEASDLAKRFGGQASTSIAVQ
jgi:NAD-dependent DNA ligase